jgi:hypothetical protein
MRSFMVFGEPPLRQTLDDVQLQLEELGQAIARQRARIERRDSAGVDWAEAEAVLVTLVESQQALVDRYRLLLKGVVLPSR